MRTFYRWLLTVFLSIAACAPSPHPVDPASTRAEARTKEPGAFAPKAVEPAPVPERSSTGGESPPNGEKNYILPAFEIVAFEVLLNLFNRNYASDHESYESDIHSIKDNLEEGWEFDRDSFDINQIGHPYQGSVYYTIARSSGLNFWESFGYSTAGSVLWEIAGETTKPSVNDQITTSIGGSFLGEALFRTAETFFRTAEHTEGTAPEVSAALTSPAAAINQQAVDLSGQDFFITGSGSDVAGRGNENITRGAAGVTMQLEGPHAITAQFTESRRNAPFSNSPDQRQRVTTAGLLYTYVFGGSAL